MASKLTGKEFEKLRDQFFKMDQDKDGKVTKEELKAYCMGQNEYRTDDQSKVQIRVRWSRVEGDGENFAKMWEYRIQTIPFN